jgi:GT2 family glycosyltransferase
VRQAGYKIMAVPASIVWHAVSSTLGKASPAIDYYMLRNHLRLVARHWSGAARLRILVSTLSEELHDILAYSVKPWGGKRLPHRNARLLALRDALLGRWGKMGPDVVAACTPNRL